MHDKVNLTIKRANSHAHKSRDARKVAYLTFDDGPNWATVRILNTLARYKACGTFFMQEPQIWRFSKVARRIVSEGHAVGLHGVTHKVNRFYASKQSVLGELKKTRYTLKKVTGKDTTLIRTPYGSIPHMKPSYVKAVRKAGYQLWDWNVDSLDWKYRDKRLVNLVKKRVIQLEKFHIQPVILMHDRPETARLLPNILTFLKKRGYSLKKLNPSLTPVSFR
ncbi:polysaccharide deacetylase [Aneurinibacillus sp. Ricciae_BoGa-3]|uniref:polysaccharide deacetylase family protein n=1 Tax=Aneurinibacillus sp. Ricciae_BoGa-3 TaxID=3022697 RepID=UPI002340C53E|nr:polysaccharide deacetylase family protein [Aneurinibacillus sp. Ricciae_BoGa-3]WCK56531.1 polysaccharide deacetylase [Aneurinibacillus sp. Ricciae_BoGa-3]